MSEGLGNDVVENAVPLLQPHSPSRSPASLAQLRQTEMKPVILLLACQLLAVIAFYLVEYNIVTYSQMYVHLKDSLIMLFVFRGSAFFLAPVFGWIADAKTGHYKVLLAGHIGFLCSTPLLCISSYFNALPTTETSGHSDSRVLVGQALYITGLVLGSVSHAATIATYLPYILVNLTGRNTTEYVLANIFSGIYFVVNTGGLIAAIAGAYLQVLPSPWKVDVPTRSHVHHKCHEAFTGFFYLYLLAAVCLTAAILILVIWSKHYYRHVPSLDHLPRLTTILMFTFCPPKERILPYDRNLLPQHEPNSEEEQIALNRNDQYKRLSVLVPKLLVFVLFGIGIAQLPSTFVEQGARMNFRLQNGIGKKEFNRARFNCSTYLDISDIYPESLQEAAKSAAILLFIPVVVLIIKPLYLKWTGLELTMLVRIRYGMVFAVLACISALSVEWQRINCNKCQDFPNPVLLVKGDLITVHVFSPLSVLYQIPQYVLFGMAEVLALVAAWEFVLSRSPQEYPGLSYSVLMMTLGLGSYLGSALVLVISHLEYYYQPFYTISVSEALPLSKMTEMKKVAMESKAYVYFICLTILMLVTFAIYVCAEHKHKDVLRTFRLPPRSKKQPST